MNKAEELKGAENLLLAIAGDVQTRAARVFKVGNWCWLCGTEDALSKCNCGMPESLQCHSQRVCAGCAGAHRTVAAHLRKMFSARRVERVTSIRAKLHSQLFNAADELEENSPLPLERTLHCALAQADPYDQTPAEFKGTVLDSFRRSQFSDFAGLARELEREVDTELKLKVARWFSCIR
jgi:hypothetical protein